MRGVLDAKNFEQIPQLSSSRELDVDTKFDITPDNFNGTKRAVLIGINYVGQEGELAGCHNDVLNMKEYLMDVHDFQEENMIVLLDDGVHKDPTKANIIAAYQQIVSDSQSGDVVYAHYSGHGGKLRDDGADEADGYDETLVPLDYQYAGQIRDGKFEVDCKKTLIYLHSHPYYVILTNSSASSYTDDLLKTLVIPMKKGVFVTAIMDCCHSGTVLDLPYTFKGDGEQTSMSHDDNFNFGPMTTILGQVANGNYMGAAASAATECCVIS